MPYPPAMPLQQRGSASDDATPSLAKHTSHTVQRGKNWNEEDSIRLVEAYAWIESTKKRIHESQIMH